MKLNFTLKKAKIVKFPCQIWPPRVFIKYLFIHSTYEHGWQMFFALNLISNRMMQPEFYFSSSVPKYTLKIRGLGGLGAII